MKFQTASTIEKVETRRDNTIKLIVSCQEMKPDQEAILMGLRNKVGFFMFKESAFVEADIVDIPEQAEFKGEKPMSVRLRSVLYVMWEQKGKPTTTFDEFYRQKMELIINWAKDKLE